jgi:hypothetical protein
VTTIGAVEAKRRAARMDGQRFDKLARVLADGSNRRGFLKRVAAVAAGAAIVSVPGRARAADYGDTCAYDDDCTGKYQTCYIANGYDYGTCQCSDGYEPYGEHCIPVDGCFKDDECNTDKHEVCVLPLNSASVTDYPVVGYCDCAVGYTYSADKGYCWSTSVDACYAPEDCTTKYYGDYDKYVLYKGKYYSKDDYGYENPLPEYECVYGECVEVIEEPNGEEPKTDPPTSGGPIIKPPKKDNKKAIMRRRRLARLRRRRAAKRRQRQNKNR